MTPAPAEAQARILVVDDDEANLVASQAVLAELGHPVITARSGPEALRAVLRDDFAVILLDVRMPGMDGYETAELIRQRERSRHVPIIFLSGVDKEASHQFRGYAAGAVDYVLKPAEPLILRSKIQVFAELYEQRRQIALKAEAERRLLAENLAVRAREAEVARELERTLMAQALVLDALPLALFVVDPGETGRRFVGGNVQSLCGAQDEPGFEPGDWLARMHPDDRPRLEAAMAGVAATGGYEIEYRLLCGAEERWMLERADARDGGEDGPQLYGVITDITTRRRLEEQLSHAQKLEAIGQLSGGVAHDFNNMLGVIVGSLDRVQATATGLDARSRGRIDLAMQAAHSCADLTKRLLGFARRQRLQPRELDVTAELNRLRGLFERVLGETVSATIELPADLPPVWLDASQFEGAIVNLVVNARDAMPEGGTLAVTARLAALEADEAAAAGVQPGPFIRLSITDSGTGMDAATQARALEPFFTTKGPDKGTGLGLSSIYGFLRQSGGGLRLESEPGRGTTVHLYLPPMTGPEAPRQPAPAAQAFDLGGLRVALVEDNASLRDVTCGMLAELGCEVTAFPSADAARGLDPAGIDLLVTDCVMPGKLNGARLCQRLRARRGDLPVLFISGFRDEAETLPTEAARLLAKPFDAAQLSAAIGALLAEAGPRRAGRPPAPR